jgi:hypothetical protein
VAGTGIGTRARPVNEIYVMVNKAYVTQRSNASRRNNQHNAT